MTPFQGLASGSLANIKQLFQYMILKNGKGGEGKAHWTMKEYTKGS